MCACQGPGAPRAPPHVTVETLDSETGYSHVRRAMGPGAAFPAMSWPGPQCTAIRGHSAGKKAPRAPLLGRLGLITQAGSCLFRIDCDSEGSYQTSHAAWAPATCTGAASGGFCNLGPLIRGLVCTPPPRLLHCPQRQIGARLVLGGCPRLGSSAVPARGDGAQGAGGVLARVGDRREPEPARVCLGVHGCARLGVCAHVRACVRARMRVRERHRLESDWR